MKVTYTFATGETNEIEVDENTGAILKDLDRQEYNNYKKETRRHRSIDMAQEFGVELAVSSVDMERDFIHKSDLEKLKNAMGVLEPHQKDLVNEVFFNGRSLKDLAAEYGVSYQAIQDRLNKILARLRKNF